MLIFSHGVVNTGNTIEHLVHYSLETWYLADSFCESMLNNASQIEHQLCLLRRYYLIPKIVVRTNYGTKQLLTTLQKLTFIVCLWISVNQFFKTCLKYISLFSPSSFLPLTYLHTCIHCCLFPLFPLLSEALGHQISSFI